LFVQTNVWDRTVAVFIEPVVVCLIGWLEDELIDMLFLNRNACGFFKTISISECVKNQPGCLLGSYLAILRLFTSMICII